MPNYKRSHHWSSYNKVARNARTLGWGLAVQALRAGIMKKPEGETVEIRLELVPPLRGGPLPDEDNIKGALKHYLDGIADAIGVNDSQFRFAPIVWHKKVGAGEVRIGF